METNNVVSIDEHRKRSEKVYVSITGEVAKDTGTKPFLCAATDGKQYWCKRVNSDHGEESVVNEVAASLIGQRMGAHVRPWKIIYVPESLRGSFIGEGTWRYRLTGDPLFGSETLHTATLHQEFTTIPFINDDANHNHIPKLIAMWTLCNVQEDIQILSDNADDNSLWSIDHGLWFDSAPYPWQFAQLEQPGGRNRVPDMRSPIPQICWDKAIEALDSLDSSLKDDLYESLPLEWNITQEKAQKLIDYALSRKDYTREVLERQKSSRGR